LKIELETRPLLYFAVGDSESPIHAGSYGLFLRNEGVGPAKIDRVMFYFDGQAIDSSKNVAKVILRNGYPEPPLDIVVSNSVVEKGAVLGSGQEVSVYAVFKDQAGSLVPTNNALKRVSALMQYSSTSQKSYSVIYPEEH
jgi:hypothetical protein